MKTRRPHPKLSKRNEQIFKQFEKMFNVDGLRIDVIYSRLSDKYFLSSQSIQKIVLNHARSIDHPAAPV